MVNTPMGSLRLEQMISGSSFRFPMWWFTQHPLVEASAVMSKPERYNFFVFASVLF